MYNKKSPETIQKMFGTIADDYDKTNSVISFGRYAKWTQKLINTVQKEKPDAKVLLDLCAGTGEVGLGWLQQQNGAKEVILLDFSPEMLLQAKKKSEHSQFQKHKISFLEADAQVIPLQDKTADAVTIAYGIRNVCDAKKCFKDVYRVLKPGGIFAILELTEPTNWFMKVGHKFYLKHIIPRVGGWMTSNRGAYQYLSNSIPAFSKPNELKKDMLEIGFQSVDLHPVFGGVLNIIVAKKSS